MFPVVASWKTAHYDSLPLNPDLEDESSTRKPKNIIADRWSRFLVGFTTTAIVVLLIALCSVTALYLRLLHEASPSPPMAENCGHSVEEAKARGCVFDELIPAWMPASCPRVGSSEFVAAGQEWESRNGTSYSSWRYFVDEELKREISVSQLKEMARDSKEGEVQWWASARWHLTHCAWILTRVAHALVNGERQDMQVADYPHTKHCTQFLLEAALECPTVDDSLSVGNVVFGSC